jgi:hypothetical protein
MREWRNEAGYLMSWHPGTGMVYILCPDGRTIRRHYEWWEMAWAEGDAVALAEAMGAEEVVYAAVAE